MHCRRTTRAQLIACGFASIATVFSSSPKACAQGNVVMALDGMIVNNTFGRFSYGGMIVGESPTLGRYGAFTISEPGNEGSGVGINFTPGFPIITSPRDGFSGPINPVTSQMFPLLDRAGFGTNFDPNEYVAEIVYKPLEGNNSTRLNV